MNSTKQKSENIIIKKMFVGLGSTVYHDKWSSFSKNESRTESEKPNGLIYFEVTNLKEASFLTRKFINEFGLGSSNWTGGRVCDENFNFIAQVSYNGRVWDNENWKIAREIKI